MLIEGISLQMTTFLKSKTITFQFGRMNLLALKYCQMTTLQQDNLKELTYLQ
jgi:hypothetical protein